jgi:hypothetical protein
MEVAYQRCIGERPMKKPAINLVVFSKGLKDHWKATCESVDKCDISWDQRHLIHSLNAQQPDFLCHDSGEDYFDIYKTLAAIIESGPEGDLFVCVGAGCQVKDPAALQKSIEMAESSNALLHLFKANTWANHDQKFYPADFDSRGILQIPIDPTFVIVKKSSLVKFRSSLIYLGWWYLSLELLNRDKTLINFESRFDPFNLPIFQTDVEYYRSFLKQKSKDSSYLEEFTGEANLLHEILMHKVVRDFEELFAKNIVHWMPRAQLPRLVAANLYNRLRLAEKKVVAAKGPL